ncbi:MAG: LysM peptidoglycan-binding domain-containing protein [bacterium]|nr:LysM peptidoglycan-binding domain-containing protein [bacterium]
MLKIFIGLFAFISVNTFALPTDSIGMKTVNGKKYIMHKVTRGEGIYGISKKYGVSSADVFAANEGSSNGIKIDQVLLIPSNSTSTTSTTASTATVTTVKKVEKKYHVVESGQTLSLIARKYNKTVDEIQKLNNLKSTNIQLGQKLIVGETVTNVQQTAQVKPTPKAVVVEDETPEIAEDTKKEPNTTPKPIPTAPENVVVVTDKMIADKNNNKPDPMVTKTYSVEDGDEVSEDGMAIISTEGELNADRSFILHPTAKIGTIVMITNPVNNNAVFARVVGTCKPGNGVILKMSKTVADKLGISEDTKVKINYAR